MKNAVSDLLLYAQLIARKWVFWLLAALDLDQGFRSS
jgi:hypothetical protein